MMLLAIGDSNWIGGLYYIKNILFSLLQNEDITKKYSFYLFFNKENEPIFKEFSSNANVQFMYATKHKVINKIIIGLSIVLKRIRIIFPSHNKAPFANVIEWIPDFQHLHLPQFFTEDELQHRNALYAETLNNGNPLVLSSNNALLDAQQYYVFSSKKIYIVHFVSYIEDIVSSIDATLENKVLDKFGLANKKYVAIMNQFWQHKNHLVVIKAMKLFFDKNPNNDLLFVFSGKLSDYRNPDYISKLKDMMDDESIKNHIVLLGFIDRKEQLIIMKNSSFIIQPSLFEGWGTVLEDAKVLDKNVALSNIPVHQEQKNDNCYLFNPNDEKDLCELIKKMQHINRVESIKNGLLEMRNKAKEYSISFQQLLEDLDV